MFDGVLMCLVVDFFILFWYVLGLEVGEGVGIGLVDGFCFFNNFVFLLCIVFELDYFVMIDSQFLFEFVLNSSNYCIVVDLVCMSEQVFCEIFGVQLVVNMIDILIVECVEVVYVFLVCECCVIVIDVGYGGYDLGVIG